eukprot:CAMPEP_0170466514 /NCGR_PEP_ID=MMETSP0123-20130129/10445_1 /TAXON_ID=182087 /ORGANISM="Favella ehrenbergii, Strain Fehren 1" /LENGTH=84 /DNA_ID=CAMNT_0010732661 /DNA_START=802 /DNA_END=1056 /DNA_ORIENTATION=-
MLVQVHELSEMLFKVQAGKVDEDFAGALLMESEASGYGAASYDAFGGDEDGEVGGISTQFQNSFTITEIKQKPFIKKRSGRKRR